MFKSPTSRYLLRTALVAVLAGLATLKASIGDGMSDEEWVNLAYSTLLAGAAYAGIGAAVPAVEPFVGNQMENPRAEVPVPPADPVPGEGTVRATRRRR